MAGDRTAQEHAAAVFEGWYAGLTVHRSSGGPARGTIAAGLVVLERLRHDFNLDLSAHRARGQSQIKGMGAAAVQRILREFGETRPFLREGGRTNRGGPGDIAGMLDAIRTMKLDRLPPEDRNGILRELQQILVARVRDFHNRQRLRIAYERSKSTWQTLHNVLSAATERGNGGPVAQHLVGAKLELRFPSASISNESYSTADVQTGRPGDFLIESTAFHVTIAPMLPLYEKCERNLADGFRVYVLVPDDVLMGTRQIANGMVTLSGRVAIDSIESFVSQNIDEMSTFSESQVVYRFRRFLEAYNKRVDEVEVDKSMMIEIPSNLASNTDANGI